MLQLGCHLSTAGGYLNMGETAQSIGANTFQFFSRNPRGGGVKTFNEPDITALRNFLTTHNFAPLIIHAPYTLNPCSATPSIRELAKEMLRADLATLEFLPHNFYTFHPGCHGGQGIAIGIAQIIEMLNEVLTAQQSTTVLLETMAGKGSEVGSQFSEIKDVIDGVKYPEKIGVCLDTCHLYCAGYDLVNKLDAVIDEFDKIIGLPRLRAAHLNDSIMKFASHKDRHEVIGGGVIGLATIGKIINHPQLKHLPFILETPHENIDGYANEIKLLRQIAE